MKSRLKLVQHFFSRLPALIILWWLGLLFGFFALLDVWLAISTMCGSNQVSNNGGSEKMVKLMLRGALENTSIVALCILGWFLMRWRARNCALAGASVIILALFITARRWIYWDLKGDNPIRWFEPALVWPCFIYLSAYAYVESKRTAITDVFAPQSPGQPHE